LRLQTLIEPDEGERADESEPFASRDLSGGVPILELAFADGMSFIDALAEGRGPAGELVVETRATPRRGTAAVAEIRWPGLPNRVYVRVWARDRLPDGRLVLRIAADELLKRDFLVGVACGTLERAHARKHHRYCVRLPMEWRRFGTRAMQPGIAEDLSAGGMLVSTADADVMRGDSIVMRMRGQFDLVVTGTVRHMHHQPALGELVMGIKFEQCDGGQVRTLRRLLRTCSGRGVMVC